MTTNLKLFGLAAIIIVGMLCVAGMAMGALTDDIISYWKFDVDSATQSDSAGSNDGTVSGAAYTSSGKINSTYSYDGTNDQISMGNPASLQVRSNFTINLWVNYTSTNKNVGVLTKDDASTDRNFYLLIRDNVWSNTIDFGVFVSGAEQSCKSTTALNDSQWHMITAIVDGTQSRIYVDGVNEKNTTLPSGIIDNDAANFVIGSFETSTTLPFPGKVDEVGIWGRALQPSEITELYNSGSGLQYPFAGDIFPSFDFLSGTPANGSNVSGNTLPYQLNFTFDYVSNVSTAQCYLWYEGNNTSNFTISVDNSTQAFDYNITNELPYALYNFTLKCNDTDNDFDPQEKFIGLYFDETIPDVTVTIPQNGSSWFNLTLNITYEDNLRLYNVTTDIYYPNGSLAYNASYSPLNTSFTDTTYIDRTGWPGGDYVLQAIACDGLDSELNCNETNVTFTFYPLVNVSLYAYPTNASISNFTIVTADGYSLSTTTGHLEVPIIGSDEVIMNISATGYASLEAHNYSSNSSYSYLNLTMYPYNSVLISIYNETDMTLIDDQNVTIYIIWDDNSSINYTDTGMLDYSFLTPENYELRFSATGFTPISKFVTVTADSTQNLSVYMQENTTTELQVIEVYDTTSTAVEGAIVWLQREQINSSPLYITVQEAQTNSEGQTGVYVVRDTEVYYRFAVIIDGEAVPIEPSGNYFTTPTFFVPGISETIRLVVNLQGGTPDYIADRISLEYTLNWTDATNTTANFTWINGGNSISGGTLKLYGKYLNSSLAYEYITENSTTGSSGYLLISVPEINNTIFKVVAYVTFDDSEIEIDTLYRTWSVDEIVEKYMGLFLSAIIFIFAAFATIELGALASSVLTFGILAILSIIGFMQIGIGVITGFIALCVIVFMKTRTT